MNTNRTFAGSLVPLSAVSIALLICSGFWYVGACEYYATSALNHDWSATPLFWTLIVMISPASCFACGMILMNARRHYRFTLIEWWALLSAFCPVTVGTLLAVWAVRVLFAMSGVSI